MEGTVPGIVRWSVVAALVAGVADRALGQVDGGTSAMSAGSVANARHLPHRGDTTGERSYVIPAVELTGFLALFNGFDRVAFANQTEDGKKVFASTFTTTWDHVREQRWVHDEDPFNVNQFGHPYQGATMFGIPRSTGLGFWPSLVYSDVGSFVWEMAGETTPPSINDLITTGQAGSLLGEALHRMAYLVLRDNGSEFARRLHEYLSIAIAPSGAVSRHVFGDRFYPGLQDSAPATAWQFGLGATVDAHAKDQLASANVLRRNAAAEFSMSYGLPGAPGYDYKRPLDYFDLQASGLSNTGNPIENVMLRGLLVGRKTGDRGNARGVWGLYGSYDYISPFLFRVSSTAVALGTTQQLWIAPAIALQGSLLGGVGYGAAGTTAGIPSTSTTEAIRDYHFGITPQSLIALRLIAGDRAMVDMTTRGYYVSGLGSDDTHGSETIFRGNVGLTLRLVGGHALAARYVESIRQARYGTLPDRRLSEGTVTIAYSFLGSNHFGAVKR
jgi:hypothetical protein